MFKIKYGFSPEPPTIASEREYEALREQPKAILVVGDGYCNPCVAYRVHLKELRERVHDIPIGYVYIDKQSEPNPEAGKLRRRIKRDFGEIRPWPTTILLQNRQEIQRIPGKQNTEKLMAIIEQYFR